MRVMKDMWEKSHMEIGKGWECIFLEMEISILENGLMKQGKESVSTFTGIINHKRELARHREKLMG